MKLLLNLKYFCKINTKYKTEIAPLHKKIPRDNQLNPTTLPRVKQVYKEKEKLVE
jgi:hypothetical protein